MKSVMYIIVTVIVVIAFYAFTIPKVDFEKDTEEGIQFYKGTWEEALPFAKKANKIIFLNIYATWCGPCKMLKRNTFSNSETGTFYNQNFINVALDGEKGEGAALAKKYAIRGYPSLLFINSDGKIVKQTAGFHNSNQLIKLGQQLITK